jgi:hypothetical protein
MLPATAGPPSPRRAEPQNQEQVEGAEPGHLEPRRHQPDGGSDRHRSSNREPVRREARHHAVSIRSVYEVA